MPTGEHLRRDLFYDENSPKKQKMLLEFIKKNDEDTLSNERKKILEFIKENDKGMGVSLFLLLNKGFQIQNVLILSSGGEIWQRIPHPSSLIVFKTSKEQLLKEYNYLSFKKEELDAINKLYEKYKDYNEIYKRRKESGYKEKYRQYFREFIGGLNTILSRFSILP